MQEELDTQAGTAAASVTPEVKPTPVQELLKQTSKPEELAEMVVTQKKMLESIPFNPFPVLDVKEVIALTGRYNKAWRTAHSVDVALAMAEFGCTADEACFYADLKSTAVGIIDRETVTTVGDTIAGLVRGIGTAQKEMSLSLIKGEFQSLKPELQNEVGKRVRDVTNKTYESATAAKLLGILYTHLGVVEKDWMR